MDGTMINTVFFEERVIPAHSITGCGDCMDFNENGGPYNDGHTCGNLWSGDSLVQYDTIPDWCPRLPDSQK